MDWIKTTLVEYETISREDVQLIKVTDDIHEVLDIMVSHRKWKSEQSDHFGL